MNSIIEDIESIIQTHNTIGVFISGGLDSAILAKLLLDTKQKLNTTNKIVFYTVPRTDDSFTHARRILKFIGHDNTISQVGNHKTHHSRQVLSGIIEALEDDSVNIFLLGDTSNPVALPEGPIRIKSDNIRVHQPFFDYTKDEVIQLAIDLEYTELFNQTHTCTESKTLRCSNCWQCRERAWAFTKLNYIDTGTM